MWSMPYSWHFPMTSMMQHVIECQPGSVLDIGVGYGKWGFLIRESLDWNSGRVDRAEWRLRIDGVEVHPYQSPLHDWVYDRILWSDVFDIQDELVGYDLVVMSDVIEHLDKNAALSLLTRLVEQNRNV